MFEYQRPRQRLDSLIRRVGLRTFCERAPGVLKYAWGLNLVVLTVEVQPPWEASP